jgi:threonine synthase
MRRLLGNGGHDYPYDPLRWCADDGTSLVLTPAAGLCPADVDTSTRSLWRYRSVLGDGQEQPVSLGEGCTPLVPASWGDHQVSFKLEWFSPTGSFKDRGTTVMISALARAGVGSVIEDSSGNGGSSVAGYCARAGIAARILVPEGTSPNKVLQARGYGAEVVVVPGDRAAAGARAVQDAEHTMYASHNWHPLFVDGVKSLAYELWEDLGFQAPDAVVTVAGSGSIVLGLDMGFGELLAAGQIDRLPRLLVAQPQRCAPVHAALHDQPPGELGPTIAEGTAIREPVRLPQVVAAIRRSAGSTAAIPEEDIVAATRRLAGTGLYAEPTCASAAAAIDVFADRGLIRPGERTVVVLTGSGLKAASAMAQVFA